MPQTHPPIFPPSLLSPAIHSATPPGYSVRPLQRDDFSRGYFDCLATLTWIGEPTQQDFEKQYDWMVAKGEGWFYNVVIDFEGRIVGTGVVIVERKFIHNFGTIGHIEDISIAKAHQGKGLGKLLINALDSVAQNIGCYKAILDCSPENEGFYRKCQYEKCGTEMSHYFEPYRSDYERG
ncbi:uncharacterized protein HMPREF1541_10232 [Cyphellophora europaea CBS 101466]|uniref:Glucosamine 6-phosphate N-acetyltransferase n=1 Tax=Cyphellophora europaea (strain CBS 101466) TaxID=1220924 RepID=W2S797_CYPE1|nr:uncharacterized protein HMPREF1541_10232 [Cyphellophora europaea CBS 101466]ETN44562.1 hypothetical protein HMPREF1541_10232 [Cyphellophora europaea CBS 101466]